jgi:hypothetical protein
MKVNGRNGSGRSRAWSERRALWETSVVMPERTVNHRGRENHPRLLLVHHLTRRKNSSTLWREITRSISREVHKNDFAREKMDAEKNQQ